jgi:hypothetical protein
MTGTNVERSLVKASARKTPQPTPAPLSGTQLSMYPTTERVAALRMNCLTRDRHRCVIYRKFDYAEAMRRVEYDGDDNANDDDGHLLKDEAGTFASLEVAHILPHSLMSSDGQTELVGYDYVYVGLTD